MESAMSCKTVLPKAEDAEHVTQTHKNGSDAMTSKLGYPCRDCLALLGEMRLAVNEAAAITEQAGVLIHATKPSEHIDEMEQIRARWEIAQQRWVLAAADLKNHFATTPRHARLSDTLQNRALSENL